MERRQSRQINVGEHIAVEDEERLVEESLQTPHGAGRAQDVLLIGIGQAHPPGRAIAKVRCYSFWFIVQINGDVIHAMACQQADQMLQKWQPADG